MIYCIKCNKYKKFKNPKISYIFKKALDFSNICFNCNSNDDKIYKQGTSTEILNVLGLNHNIKRVKHIVSHISDKYGRKKKFKNLFHRKSKTKRFNEYKDQKPCTVLNYIKQLLILVSAITGCVSIFTLLL